MWSDTVTVAVPVDELPLVPPPVWPKENPCRRIQETINRQLQFRAPNMSQPFQSLLHWHLSPDLHPIVYQTIIFDSSGFIPRAPGPTTVITDGIRESPSKKTYVNWTLNYPFKASTDHQKANLMI
jgi:hypothetical protein